MISTTQHVNRTLFVDMMSPRGHVRLNRFYLSRLLGPEARIMVADDLADQYSDFNILSLGVKPCGSALVERLALALHILDLVRREMPKRLVFLSYDLTTLPIMSHVLRKYGTEIFCFEHNTAPSTLLRRYWHKLSAKGTKHFVYTPFLQNIYLSLGLDALYVPHPCIPCEVKQTESIEWQTIIAKRAETHSAVGLCPSGSITVTQMEQIAVMHPDILFVLKSKTSSDLNNLVTQPYFQDYGFALRHCDFVAVPFVSNYKVSGPIFEAIAMKKPVMVLNNLFGQHLKSTFPTLVFFPGEPIPSPENPCNIEEHNHSVIQRLTNALY